MAGKAGAVVTLKVDYETSLKGWRVVIEGVGVGTAEQVKRDVLDQIEPAAKLLPGVQVLRVMTLRPRKKKRKYW